MTAMVTYDWASGEYIHHATDPVREAFEGAVAQVAAQAREELPATSARLESARAMVLAGDVTLHGDGTAHVQSQTSGQQGYVVCNGTCECPDAPRAPQGWCKHRLAVAIHKRATEVARAQLRALDQDEKSLDDTEGKGGVRPATPPDVCQDIEDKPAAKSRCPEAVFSLNLRGKLAGTDAQLTVRGQSWAEFRRNVAHVRGFFDGAADQDTGAADAAPAPAAHYCVYHGALKPSSKVPGTWYCPAKGADGTYCRSRWPAK